MGRTLYSYTCVRAPFDDRLGRQHRRGIVRWDDDDRVQIPLRCRARESLTLVPTVNATLGAWALSRRPPLGGIIGRYRPLWARWARRSTRWWATASSRRCSTGSWMPSLHAPRVWSIVDGGRDPSRC